MHTDLQGINYLNNALKLCKMNELFQLKKLIINIFIFFKIRYLKDVSR